MIEFACASCGQCFKVNDDWAGKRARCKKCGQTVYVPPQENGSDDEEDVASSASDSYEGSVETGGGSLTESERRILRIGIIAAVAVVPLLLAVLFLPGMFRQWSYNRTLALVEPEVRDGIENAKAQARSFDFDAANTDLVNLKDVISKAEVSPEQTDDLNGRVSAAQAEVQSEKAEYDRKIGQGYALKGGRLVSPEEQKAQADRERDEQTAKTAELWRQYKQKQDADEKVAADREAAAQAERQRQQQLAQQQQQQQQQQAAANAEWQHHVRTLVEYTDMLDKTLKLMAQGDGISYNDLVTSAKVLNQYADNIYVADGDKTMGTNALKAKTLAKSFSIAAASWLTAINASKTGPADPSYDFKISVAKQSLADRDEELNKASQTGQVISQSVHALAAQAGIRTGQ